MCTRDIRTSHNKNKKTRRTQKSDLLVFYMWGPHPPLRATCPLCGARKMLRAYAFPCIFRLLQKLRVPFFRRRQRELAIPVRGKALRAVEDASPYKNTERRDNPSVTRRDVTRRATSPLAQGRLYGPPRASRRARNARRSKLCSAPTGYGRAGRVPPLSQPADTPVDSSPRGGSQVACAPFWQGGHCGGRAVLFGLHNLYIGLHILVCVI